MKTDRIYRIQYKMILDEHEPFNHWLNFGNDVDGYPDQQSAIDYITDFGYRYAQSFDCPVVFRIFVIETRDVNEIIIGDWDNVQSKI